MKVRQTNDKRFHACLRLYLFIHLFGVIPHSERIRTSRFRKFAVSTEEPKFVTRNRRCIGL